jgi:signal peptidase I
MLIKYLKAIYKDPLKVTIHRRNKIEKEYGSLESLLRTLLLPVESKNAILDILKELVLIILPIITFGVVFMNVISGSMYPTIQTGDSLLASNIYYGGKFSAITFNKWWYSNKSLIKFGKPRKGHIVVFKDDIDKDKTWVKRIIGEPGETIQFKNGILHINDIPVKLKFKTNHYWLKEKGEYSGPYEEFEETLPNGISYSIIMQKNGIHRNTPKYYIPEGYYFMVGDNRDNSADSRSVLGYVPAENISGRVMFVVLHHQHGFIGTLFGNPILWVKGFDFSRIFKKI